jgi:hypothetical protein
MTKRNTKQNQRRPEKMLNVRMSLDDYGRLQRLARSEHRSVSQEVRFLIDQRLTDPSEPPGEKAAA